MLNSRLSLFTATTKKWLPFSRSYGVILPSSLTRVIPLVLGFSPRLPVSVCGTGTSNLHSSFSRQREFSNFHTYFLSPSYPSINNAYFTTLSASVFGRTLPNARIAYPSVSLHLSNNYWWYRNLNLLSIAYSIRSRLRSRLTLGGRAFPRKPWAFDDKDSHFILATHTGILSRVSSTFPYEKASA